MEGNMQESTQLTIGMRALCFDGDCGEVIKVVVDPVAQAVTHLVIEPKHRAGMGRLVSLDLVTSSSDVVQLNCTTAEFEDLEMVEEIQFLPGSSGYAGYTEQEMLAWPYYGIGGGLGAGNTPQTITHESLPLGEVAIRRDEQVHALDGEIGRVQGLVISPHNHQVTHVLLQEGHFWSHKEVAIPIGAVSRIDDGIRLTLTKAEVENLPAVDVNSFNG
jgi:sporulation protein YlmC with PRC-barrel domain